jgi:hypothetical protein
MHVDRVYFGNFLNENWMIKVAIYAATILTGATLLYLFIEGNFFGFGNALFLRCLLRNRLPSLRRAWRNRDVSGEALNAAPGFIERVALDGGSGTRTRHE